MTTRPLGEKFFEKISIYVLTRRCPTCNLVAIKEKSFLISIDNPLKSVYLKGRSMKKILLALLGAITLASISTAQTNVVLSRNAVGYVRVDLIATNKLHLLRNDFVGLSSPIAISNALSTLPVGTQVILHDKVNQVYKSPIVRTTFGWGSGGTNQLIRGSSFFIRTPNSSTNVPIIPLYFMGEVPDRFTAPTTTIAVLPGNNFDGYPYPVSRHWTNMTYSQLLSIGSQIITWNVTSQQYNAPISKSAFGWGAAGNALILHPGQGFIVKTTNSFVWSETKPYTWP